MTKTPQIDEKKLISDFASGIEERNYTSVFLVSKNFVVFKVKGHSAWASVGARAYVRGRYILIRRGEWWMATEGSKREWEGRVSKSILAEALRRSEMTNEVYRGSMDAPMCEECNEEMARGAGLENGRITEYWRCDSCGWSENVS